MQKYVEDACYDHLVKNLQPHFRKPTGQSPFGSGVSRKRVASIMEKSMRNSDRYKNLKKQGWDDEKIFKSFQEPIDMTLFSYNGDIEKTMSPYDSIFYYKSFLRCGFMSMDPYTGAVKAYVGGLDYEHFSYDMAMEGRRQVGSTMKPYLYSLAMENGWVPCDVVSAQRRVYNVGGEKWSPKGGVGGMMSLKSALACSSNQVSAYLMSKLDPHQLVDLLKNYGIRNNQIQPYLSLCLGPCEIKVGEMVSGYTAFPNRGVRTAPMFVSKIVDSHGNIVATFKPRMNEVISEGSSYKMITLMRAVVNEGTGRRIRGYYSGDLAGKTGTTNENSDAWFMGYTPELVCGAWVGGEDRDIHFYSTSIGQGAAAALPIIGKYLKSVYSDQTLPYDKTKRFDIPKDFDPCKKKNDKGNEIGVEDVYE